LGLRGNVDVSCVRRWLALTAEELRSDVFEPPFGDLGERQVLYLHPVGKRVIDFL